MFNPEEYIIFEGFSGSHLYGTATEESDVDTRGVVVPPMDVLIDPFNEFNVKDSFESGDDRALYSLKAFFKLCADNNPNVLELLFVPSDKTMFKSARWDYIQKNRRLFLSKNIKHRFLGYAVSQLKKIERHREWFINPPSHKPTRKEFGLKEHSLVPDTVMQNVFGISQDLFIKEYRDEFAAERNYREAKRNWDNYYKWQKERNPKRRGSEEKYGYDCYTEDTEFLTECGWKKYFEISNDEKIGTINPKYKTIEFHNFSNRVSYFMDDYVFVVETQDTKCEVTGNHNIFLSDVHRSTKNNFSRLYSDADSNWRLLRVNDIVSGHRSMYHVLSNPKNENEEYDVDDYYLTLMGLYVSEGSLLRHRDRDPEKINGVSISQLEKPNKIINEINFIREKYNVKEYRCKRKGRFELVYNIYNSALGERLYKDCREYSKGKTLPDWVRLLSKRQSEILLLSAMSGDGSKYKHSMVYYTSSRELAGKMQLLGLLCEMQSKDRVYKSNVENGMHQVFYSKFYGQHGILNKNNIKKIKYRGNVVCFEVQNSILITRKDGKVSFHGNSKCASHLFRLMYEGKELLLTGDLKFPLAIADELLEIKNGKYTFEEVCSEAARMEKDFDMWYEKSRLRNSPNRNKLTELYYDIVS